MTRRTPRRSGRNSIAWFLMVVLVMTASVACETKKVDVGPDGFDVVVIGAGGGGIAAAAALARGGLKVLVIEQHDKVGGYMTDFERDGYRFEVSLHAMDGLGVQAFEALGIDEKVKTVTTEYAYISAFPDAEYYIPTDAEAYRKMLKEKFPHEARGIDRLWKTLESLDFVMVNLMDLGEGKNVAGSIFRLLTSPGKLLKLARYWSKSCTEILGNYIQDEKLFAVFTQLMSYTGVDPYNVSGMLFAMMWNSYHFHGFYYFEGGSQAVTNALAEVVMENGGQILLNTLATRIVIEDGRAVAVETRDGKSFRCRYVVSNANAPDTFFKMIGREHLPDDYVKRLETMKIGASAFAVYLGVNKDLSSAFPKGIHSYFINPGYDSSEVFEYFTKGVPEKAQFGLINYTMEDPTNAPEGKNVIALVSMMPYDYKGDWYESQSYAKYHALKEEVAWKFIDRSEKYLPGLKDHIEVMEVGSPRTMERYTLNPKGTIFGWEYNIEQSMLKRLKQETPIPNLYLAGAWTFPGGGQSAVLISGLTAARLILKKE